MFMYIRLQIHRCKRKKNTSQISFIILMSCTEFVKVQRLSTLPNINMPKYCLSISNDWMYNFHFPDKILFMKSGHYKTTCWANSLSFPVVCFIWINSWCLFKDSSYVICGRHHPTSTESSQTEHVLFLDKELSIFRCLSDGYYVTLLDCATWFV